MIITKENDMENDTVTITVDEYIELQDIAEFMSYLEAAGLDNWEGYDHAIELMRNDE